MKDIKINEIKPLFTTIITTLDVYEEDLIENGALKAPQGTLRMYQKVLAVGDSVRGVKVGDIVLLNFENYIKRKYKEKTGMLTYHPPFNFKQFCKDMLSKF